MEEENNVGSKLKINMVNQKYTTCDFGELLGAAKKYQRKQSTGLFRNFARNELKKHQLIHSFRNTQGQAKISTVGSQSINFEL